MISIIAGFATRRTVSKLVVLAASAMLTACAATQDVRRIDRLETVRENPRIVLMPPDIRYYRLTAGGILEPHAEWTKAAQTNFSRAVQNFARSGGTELSIVDADDMGEMDIEYETLHSAVGMTILNHQFGTFKLPSKGNGKVFDWTLGPGISVLADAHDADYGLFVYYRDYQATGGRIAFMILAAAAGIVVPAGAGAEIGFASLVDLRTGEIVWFNVVRVGAGEFRKPEGAETAVNLLFKDIPVNEVPEQGG